MPTAVQDVHRTSDAPGSAPQLPCEAVPDRGDGPKLLNHAPQKVVGAAPVSAPSTAEPGPACSKTGPHSLPPPIRESFPKLCFF